MSPSPNAILQRALEILRSKQCWCKRSKYVNHAFCGRCYANLTGEQRDLIARRGSAFVENYDHVVASLIPRVRMAKPVPDYPD